MRVHTFIKKHCSLFLFAVVSSTAIAQTSNFEQPLGTAVYEEGHSMRMTPDGGYILLGVEVPTPYDFLLMKTDAGGNLSWSKNFDNAGNPDFGLSVDTTNDGGFILGGWTGANGTDILVIKTDGSGNESWRKFFGGAGEEQAHCIRQTSDGGYIIAGYTNSIGAGDHDAYFIKTDASGNLSWEKTYGGAPLDKAHYIEQTKDGGYIAVGETETAVPGNKSLWLLRMDSNGDTTAYWTKKYGSTISIGWEVHENADGSFITVGETNPTGVRKIYFIRTAANGSTIVEDTIAQGATNAIIGYSIVHMCDGNYAIAGVVDDASAFHDYLIMVADSMGNTIWKKSWGDNGASFKQDRAYSILQTPAGDLTSFGFTETIGAGSADFYLIQIDGSCPPVGMVEFASVNLTSVSIYPNPLTTSATLRVTGDKGQGTREFIIYDLLGREVMRSVIPSGARNLMIQRSNLPAGMYFYQVKSEREGEIIAKGKIIIQ